MKKITLALMYFSLLLPLTACQESFKQEVFQGVTIGGTLNDGLTYFGNRKVKSAIDGILHRHDKRAIGKLLNVHSDGEGSYEKGYIFAQLVYKVGEDEFISLCSELDQGEREQLYSLLWAGLEYYYHIDINGKERDIVKATFPKLFQALKVKGYG